MKLSGGVDGGAEPPAFQRAEMKRKKAEAQIEESSSNFSLFDEESGPTVQVRPHFISANLDQLIIVDPMVNGSVLGSVPLIRLETKRMDYQIS